MRDTTNLTRQRPTRFPDSDAYPEERAPHPKSARAIDCSAADAERRAQAARAAGRQEGSGVDEPPPSSRRQSPSGRQAH
jgi:hypothetical protein